MCFAMSLISLKVMEHHISDKFPNSMSLPWPIPRQHEAVWLFFLLSRGTWRLSSWCQGKTHNRPQKGWKQGLLHNRRDDGTACRGRRSPFCTPLRKHIQWKICDRVGDTGLITGVCGYGIDVCGNRSIATNEEREEKKSRWWNDPSAARYATYSVVLMPGFCSWLSGGSQCIIALLSQVQICV